MRVVSTSSGSSVTARSVQAVVSAGRTGSPTDTQPACGNDDANVLSQRGASSTVESSSTNRQFPQW